MKKFVGVDCHKDTLACYQDNRFQEFPNTKEGFEAAVQWASKGSTWALEGAYCYGKAFSSYLIKKKYEVLEVNSYLTSSYRSIIALDGSKSDYGDAKVIYHLAQTINFEPVSLATSKLKELLTTRKFVVKRQTELINHLRSLYVTRGEKLDFPDLKTQKAIKWLLNNGDQIVKSLTKQLDESITLSKSLEELIENELPEKARVLELLTGIKTLTAATIYTELKEKKCSSAQFASYSGIAPIENSSGKRSRHKHNKKGNRILNSIFYRLSRNQAKFDEEGRKYYEKKLKEGKTERQAKKCLARQLVNIVWKMLNPPEERILELYQQKIQEKSIA